MIGLVVVAHSRRLAEAAAAFARSVGDGESARIVVAAGLEGGALGTDAAAISKAIAAAGDGDGVLVLLDVGSALLSAELAVEFLPDDVSDRILISSAPLVEGLVAAAAAAASGAGLDEVDAAAHAAHALKAEHVDGGLPAGPLPLPAASDRPRVRHALVWRTTIRNPHGLHIRPAAAVVTALADLDAEVELTNATTGLGPAPATSLSRVAALQVGRGQVLQARITGPDAARARLALADLASRDFGEDLSVRPGRTAGPRLRRPAASAAVGPTDTLPVIGRATLRSSGPSTRGYLPGSPKDELARFTASVTAVADFLASLAVGGDPTGILAAQATLLADRELNHDIVSRITEGFSAPDAVSRELARAARSFEEFSDAYLRERAQDFRGLRRLLLLALLGRPLVDEGPDEPRVWVIDELDAPTALRLDPRTCLGVITTSGGASGHGVLTARARGLAVLPGCREAADLADGDEVAFDPVTGEFWRQPDADCRAGLADLRVARRQAAQRALGRALEPAVTTAGVVVPVLANVSTLDDARAAHRLGADGAGLVRTEILFSTRVQAPSVQEQADAYAAIGAALGGRPLTLRTWDVGADKPLAFLPEFKGDNPALGVRGIRAMTRAVDVFTDQLRAIVLTACRVPVRVMFPMVSTVEEMRWARGVLADVCGELGADPVPVGMMVEVPATALRAADFAGLVDFASVGTNDLAQYARAADRTDPDVGALAAQDDPAVLDLIRLTCAGLRGVPVAVCGDLAADPTRTRDLLGLGVAELSVSPPRVPEVKEAVRAC